MVIEGTLNGSGLSRAAYMHLYGVILYITVLNDHDTLNYRTFAHHFFTSISQYFIPK